VAIEQQEDQVLLNAFVPTSAIVQSRRSPKESVANEFIGDGRYANKCPQPANLVDCCFVPKMTYVCSPQKSGRRCGGLVNNGAFLALPVVYTQAYQACQQIKNDLAAGRAKSFSRSQFSESFR
jgi:hypothetical protein